MDNNPSPDHIPTADIESSNTSSSPANPPQQPQTPAPLPRSGMKVIQPISSDLTAASVAQPQSQPTTSPTPSQEPTQPPTGNADPSPNPPFNTPPPRPAPSSVYPEATQGMSASSYQTPSPADNKKDTNETYNFSNGYSIGGSIFWFQLLAGIVLGLILFGIDSSVLKTASIAVIGIVSLLYYLVEFFVVAYIPYNTLKSNNVDEPFWLTTFGVAVQAIIIATLFELVISLIIRSVINHGVSSSLAHIGGAGLGGIAIVVYIGFFIASYFLTKLSWGIAFSLFGKIKNKTIVKAIGIGVIAIIVGGIAYHYLTLHSSTLGSSQTKVKIAQQEPGSTVYTDPTTGFEITPPANWTAGAGGSSTVDGQKSIFASWYYQNNIIDDLTVNTTSPSSGSLQSDVQDWQSSKSSSDSDYKLISSTATTVNGVPAYLITDSWTTKTLKPQKVTDQAVIEDYNGTEYTVDGNSYTQYASSFSSVLKSALLSFKP
ncbi:MAG TPA: hypothetical protein VGF75_06460 [Candidatus Saccharimonadales bacterium]|jgi:hypothetical protein